MCPFLLLFASRTLGHFIARIFENQIDRSKARHRDLLMMPEKRLVLRKPASWYQNRVSYQLVPSDFYCQLFHRHQQRRPNHISRVNFDYGPIDLSKVDGAGNGANATIQVVVNSGEGTLYQCIDVVKSPSLMPAIQTFTSSASSASIATITPFSSLQNEIQDEGNHGGANNLGLRGYIASGRRQSGKRSWRSCEPHRCCKTTTSDGMGFIIEDLSSLALALSFA
ncbi:hypothetical protein BC830DRAFT_1222160 [Chytriomyces sp. MP71]|nr:hypothetical protein BC830DRAFT_1222160 [Chytriomyces sp. MP71]